MSGGGAERRGQGLVRVPFVRRCQIELESGGLWPAYFVNISVLGAYLAPGAPGIPADPQAAWPTVGQLLLCRFHPPGVDADMSVRAVVTWLNPRQQHPVHSLPPGFGVHFQDIPEGDRRRVERIVQEQIARQPQLG